MTICSEGVYYLVVMGFILTAALIRQINLLMVLYGVLAGPLLLSWGIVRRQVKRVEVSRRAPKTVVAGEPFSVELEIHNGKNRGGSFGLRVVDELEKRGGGAGTKSLTAEVYCSYVPAGESRRATYLGRLPRRGVYDFQPLKVASRFPMGLLRTMIRIDKPQRILGLPKLGRLSPAWRRLLRNEQGTTSGARSWAGVQDGDFYGLREWRPGDARNRIHWRTSARRRSLTVRQYERRHDSSLLLVVELWQPQKPTDADRLRVEAVASFAGSVIAEACREGTRTVRMHLAAQRSRRIEGSGSSALSHEAQQALAAADATASDALPAVLTAALAGERPQSNVVIVSTRPTDLSDAGRFASLHAASELQPWIARALCLTPDDARWSSMFQGADA
jgi:uncharacterized protein (DUF58 family)